MIANSSQAWSERAELPTSWQAALWSATGQKQRFVSVVDALDPQQGETLLDYGCGTGALTEQLRDGIQYLGYDRAAGMVARAERDHPYRDFTRTWPLGTFDLVACVGPFNLLEGWSKTKTWDTLSRLWFQTGRALAVSLLASSDEDCLLYTMDECERFASRLTQRYRVRQHLPNDLLLVLER